MKPSLTKKLLILTFQLLSYFLLFSGLYGISAQFLPSGSPYVAFLVTMGIILLIHFPFNEWLHRFIDHQFYRKVYRFRRIIETFNRELNTIIEYERLIKKIVYYLDKAFGSNHYAFWIYKERTFELQNSPSGLKGVPQRFNYSPGRNRCQVFHHPFRFIDRGCLESRYGSCQKLVRLLQAIPDFEYVVPLALNGKIWGLLAFHRSIAYYIESREIRDYLCGLFQKMTNVLENAAIHSETKRKSLQNELLLEISKKISSTLNFREVLEQIIDSVSRLVSYDAAAIFITDQDRGILRHMVTRGYDRKLLDKMPLKLNQGIAGWVIRTRKSSIIPDVRKDPHYYSLRKQTRSQLTIPLFSGEKVIGVLVLESDQPNHYTHADLELLTSLASLASIAIANAQLYEDSLKKKKLESELLVASSVQQALLPQRPPRVEGLQIDVLNIPSLIVGGDLYDLFRIKGNKLGLAIGDVSGKGAPGAILMAMVYAGFKSLLKEIWEVSEIVAHLNNFLVETTTEGYFTTFFFGIIDPELKQFTYCNAGHNPPFHFRKDGQIDHLMDGGTVLGFLRDQSYVQKTIQLESGDYLVFYTDGITELKNSMGEEFGEERLIRLIRENQGKSPRELKNEVMKALRSFTRRSTFQDDVTLIIVYVE
ncbi:MAG: SpoIIE family protein phosphatase [Calditrichaeota bacterium]|nr:SpoIIE family protein phosphatase [Calditrichota bacterium]